MKHTHHETPIEEHGVKFPKLNKMNIIEEYLFQIVNGNYHTTTVLVTDTVEMETHAEYRAFTRSLLLDRDWLDGKGGARIDTEEAGLSDNMDEWGSDDWKIARRFSTTLAVKVLPPSTSETMAPLYVNPEGHSYARYVGFGSQPERTRSTYRGTVNVRWRTHTTTPASR